MSKKHQSTSRPSPAKLDPQITFSEERGVRYMHFGSTWIQGGMRIRKPWWLEFEYTQQMMAWLLFLEPSKPFQVCQLGLGAGSLTKFCYKIQQKHWHNLKTTAVEISPLVVMSAKMMFELPDNNDQLSVLIMDAWDFVEDVKQRQTVDVLQIDLYDSAAKGPVLSSLAFYQKCFQVLKSVGILTVNLFGADNELPEDTFNQNINALCDAFGDRVLVFPQTEDGNVVAIAFKGPPLQLDWDRLMDRAKTVQKMTGLPAKQWVLDLQAANHHQECCLTI